MLYLCILAFSVFLLFPTKLERSGPGSPTRWVAAHGPLLVFLILSGLLDFAGERLKRLRTTSPEATCNLGGEPGVRGTQPL